MSAAAWRLTSAQLAVLRRLTGPTAGEIRTVAGLPATIHARRGDGSRLATVPEPTFRRLRILGVIARHVEPMQYAHGVGVWRITARGRAALRRAK
jgi:hypothetical protein